MISLKKELKRARLFEVQKLTKRIRVVERRRGTELQLEKNQRKVERLQHELELIKDVDISELCSRIRAKDERTIQLATQEQAPASSEEKAEWRILISKTASGYLKDLLKEEDRSSEPIHQDDRVPDCDVHKSSPKVSNLDISEHSVLLELKGRGKDQSGSDESSDECLTINRKGGEKGLSSMFVMSLSAIGSEKKQSHKKRKAVVRKNRNRLGQRARRRLWEEKYGSSAKHLIRVKTKRKCARRPGGGSGASKEIQSSEVNTTLHPSWTAKRKQQTTIQQFQGQKIVFESD